MEQADICQEKLFAEDQFVDACYRGDKELVLSMIASYPESFAQSEKESQYNFWTQGLVSACTGGHIDIAELMIEKGAWNWDDGFANACCNGHNNVVLRLIEMGVTCWQRGLANACCGGHKELVKLMIAKGADDSSRMDWNEGLRHACQGAHGTCRIDD